jgi:enoyl-CoA hydratase/carnithine racemase
MTDPRVLLDTGDHVARITLNAPKSLNALDAAMLDALADVVEQVAADADVRVIVLTGAGRGFCSGANLLDPSVEVDVKTLYAVGRVVRALTGAPQAVVARVNGVAAGAGLSLALAADIVLVAESAPLTLSFSKIGLMPDGGATQLVSASIGRARAMRLALLGQHLGAREAEAAGLIAEAVPDERLDERTAAVVAQLAALDPRATALTKAAVNDASLNLDATLEREERGQSELLSAPAFAEGVAAFREKRAPLFHHLAAAQSQES